MSAVSRPVCIAVMLLLSSGSLLAQQGRDPLTQSEVEEVRDASWEPNQRLTLYVGFARARLVKLEQMRSDPKTKDRAQQTHDLLDDFQALYDELNDNIETYVERNDDIRKPLKGVIAADTEFQAKLRALKEAADVRRSEYSVYEFVLSNALDTVDSSADDHRKLLDNQEEAAKHKKLNHDSGGAGRPG